MQKPKKLIKIAIVEDDLYFNKALKRYLETICNHSTYPQFEFQIDSFLNAHECIEEMDDDIDIMILDYILINKEESEVLSAMDVIRELKQINPDCKVILYSGQQSAHTAVELMKAGIHIYIDKSVNDSNRIGSVVQSLLAEWA